MMERQQGPVHQHRPRVVRSARVRGPSTETPTAQTPDAQRQRLPGEHGRCGHRPPRPRAVCAHAGDQLQRIRPTCNPLILGRGAAVTARYRTDPRHALGHTHLHDFADEPVEKSHQLACGQIDLLLQLVHGLMLQAKPQEKSLEDGKPSE